jgi:hypothetical protein
MKQVVVKEECIYVDEAQAKTVLAAFAESTAKLEMQVWQAC